jgi:hypothetical protein
MKVNELAVKTDLLKTKNDTVATLMDLTGKNYDLARQAFNDKFSRAMDVQRLYNENQTLEISRETLANTISNQARDDARANLSVITDGMATSNKSWADLSPTQQAQVSQLELKAGLPAGTIKAFNANKPGAKILATVNGTDASGNDIVTFVYADKNGNPGTTKVIKTGGKSAVPGSSSSSSAKVTLTAKNTVQEDDGKGGSSFHMTDGTPITAGQYAAAHKTTLGSVLPKEKDTTIKDINDTLQWYHDNGYSTSSTRAAFQNNMSHVFGGLSDSEFTQITGFTPMTAAEKKAAGL